MSYATNVFSGFGAVAPDRIGSVAPSSSYAGLQPYYVGAYSQNPQELSGGGYSGQPARRAASSQTLGRDSRGKPKPRRVANPAITAAIRRTSGKSRQLAAILKALRESAPRQR